MNPEIIIKKQTKQNKIRPTVRTYVRTYIDESKSKKKIRPFLQPRMNQFSGLT